LGSGDRGDISDGPRSVIEQEGPLFERARRAGWRLLPGSEGFDLLERLGLEVPVSWRFQDPAALEAGDLDRIPGDRVVLKVDCADLAHKTESGGVRILPRDLQAVRQAAREMSGQVDFGFQGFFIQELVETGLGMGQELLLSFVWDREFGPIMNVGAGGIHSTVMARHLNPEAAIAINSLDPLYGEDLIASLPGLLSVSLLTEAQRGQPAQMGLTDLVTQFERWAPSVAALLATEIDELEINPLVVRGGKLVALDVLVRLADSRGELPAARPQEKLRCLLEPQSIGIIGVSRDLNPGHLILNNLLREGFHPASVYVIKSGLTEVEGCRCFEALEQLPCRVDLLVVAVGAPQVPGLLLEVIGKRLAESLIVIPGGLEEKVGSESIWDEVLDTLQQARQTRWGGPVINGGNCMGIRSAPGQYDTFFLPDYKLPPAGTLGSKAALIAQSGAFLAAKSSKLASISFKYSVSIGNQLDLTVGDYLEYLALDPDLKVLAAYVEGFKTLDGMRFLQVARQMYHRGGTIVLYRAGRSEAGREAAASHTASLAGSYLRTAALGRSAGVLVTETLDDFEDLVGLAVGLDGRSPVFSRLGGLSNAGFECVVLSDHLSWFSPAALSTSSIAALESLLKQGGVASLVEVRNPLDLTPIMPDELFARAAEVIVTDPNVDVGVIGCVPLTGALNTLPASPAHGEDNAGMEAIASRLGALWERTNKPWVIVVDAGRPYDCLADRLNRFGIPVFRQMDRALRALELLARYEAARSQSEIESNPQG
jgi:acyl-CoA synthetase (NDP forming)